MMKWLTFYILCTVASWELEGNTKLLFVFAFAFRTLLCSLHTLLWKIGEPWKPCAKPCAWIEMFAAFGKCSHPAFAPEEKCLRPMKKCSRLLRNVCGLWKMFAPNLCAWREMFAAYEKMFALAEKCLRPMKNVRAQPLRLKRNVCGLWKMFVPVEKCLRPMKKWS